MKALAKQGGFKIPESQTPWQEIQRGMVDELSRGMVLKPAVKYQRISTTQGHAAGQPLSAADQGVGGRRASSRILASP